jgi:nitrous oxidase accessory protein NosD
MPVLPAECGVLNVDGLLRERSMIAGLILAATMGLMAPSGDLPEVIVREDNTVIKESCRIVVPEGTVIPDQDGNGVIQIQASGIAVEFAEGSVLRGAKADARPDEHRGYGIRIARQSNVTIRGARVHGFWCGIWATGANGLTIEDADASNNRAAYLKSTPAAEDAGDWLTPHENDKNEWLQRYGAAVYVEDAENVTVRRCRARHGQNGLGLDRVNGAKVYDNDFSFLSGWGIALWRANRNVISRNAVDFCVRGYSHNVYNRGQDSAGILMFEQCCENVVAENSATHGGDGFFGFAGREALGEAPAPTPDFDYRRRGNNDNLLVKNDFSYAPAHGIEMTFSFGNKFLANRLVGNAICGVWSGYSQETLIAGNEIEDNGGMGYGAERGGVNIEHGRKNLIVHNQFKKNRCGVHLWWDADEGLATRPWALANGVESKDNLIAANEFTGDDLALNFRGVSEATVGPNQISGVKTEMLVEAESKVIRTDGAAAPALEIPQYPVYGDTRPVGARPELRGRENIVMTEWGPWDHAAPLVQLVETAGTSHVYDLHQMPRKLSVTIIGDGIKGHLTPATAKNPAARYVVSAKEKGVFPYTLRIVAGDYQKVIRATLPALSWDVSFFKWTKETDPRENLAGYRKLAEGETAVKATAEQLVFKYGSGGPSELKLSDALTKANLGGDHFGMIARTHTTLGKGKWKAATLSDDGVRVTVDGQPVIDNWTWHVPTRDEGTFEMAEPKAVEIVVEHFEIDGYAVLDFDLTPVR